MTNKPDILSKECHYSKQRNAINRSIARFSILNIYALTNPPLSLKTSSNKDSIKV